MKTNLLKTKKSFGNKMCYMPLKNKLFIVVMILLTLVFLGQVPTPGINPDYFKSIIESNAALGFFNTINGNALSKLSIMTLSVSPYITASIVLQLLAIVFPKLADIQKDGATGEKKYKKILIFTGIGFSFAEALAMAIGFGKQGLLYNYSIGWVLLVTAIWTLCATITILVGEFIDLMKIGSGISLILTTNILVSFNDSFAFLFNKYVLGHKLAFALLGIVIIVSITFLITLYITEITTAEKNITISCSTKAYQGQRKMTHNIPIKLCIGGVVPIIFASTLINLPVMIAAFTGHENALKFLNSSYWFTSPKYVIGAVLYIALIFAFSFFYSSIVFNPKEIANNIRKSGQTINGIRNGKETEEYLELQTNRIIWIGAAALSVVAILPNIIDAIFHVGQLSFAGTSMIIIVSVILETTKNIKSQTKKQQYKKLLK